MKTQAENKSVDYADATARLMAKMSAERAAQVYDFARFMLAQAERRRGGKEESGDWLFDSEEQMQQEDEQWEAAYGKHQEKFAALEDAARKEIAESKALPMFDKRGEIKLE